ncbi:hypothetical protein N7447_010938 [Penicillium robsamsonii]|uniref:uncharacterized protein n=1 Tax=Penicillium robsamsonii TaxID=1792511 RepID=UPI0025483109|nr:uncharacterized protein N7447_010938 [Penicillium robsamsonii]KAJ5807482.1 hypothetical protein N7447_010938 [Penicillium robsamsonii]
MAIFDSEKRPRGLRVPSLAGLKSSATKSQFSFQKKSDLLEETSKPIAASAPPPKPAPPPDKELPLPPKEEIPRSASDNPYFPPIPRNAVPERRPIERVPVPTQSSSSRTTGMRSKKSQPDFHAPQQPTPVTPSPPPQIPTIVQDSAPAPVPVPADEANSPQLEDLIPTPDSAEPPLAVPELSREELAPSPFVPPDIEPVAPSLNEIHLTCYQQHRAMPVAQNTWCPMPCMTCQKFDIEIRHRCVFCCLRICESCYQTLQKCKNRSVEELVDRIAV